MTLFLHTRIHRVRLRDWVAAQVSVTDEPPRPLVVVCPTCGETFFADLTPGGNPDARRLTEWEAVARLDGECPDHPHWFTVKP